MTGFVKFDAGLRRVGLQKTFKMVLSVIGDTYGPRNKLAEVRYSRNVTFGDLITRKVRNLGCGLNLGVRFCPLWMLEVQLIQVGLGFMTRIVNVLIPYFLMQM